MTIVRTTIARSISFACLAGIIAALLPAVAAAAQGQRPQHGPPPEAFAACESQEDGSVCQFAAPHGTVEGTCRTPRGERLVCVPNHHRRP